MNLIADYAADRMAGTEIAIRLPSWEAEAVDAAARARAAVPITARQELAWQIKELRQYTEAPNSALKELIRVNESERQYDFGNQMRGY